VVVGIVVVVDVVVVSAAENPEQAANASAMTAMPKVGFTGISTEPTSDVRTSGSEDAGSTSAPAPTD
jgi:hypothetical protein